MTRPRAVTSVQINGPALRYVRETKGLTIAQLARAADVSTGFLSRVELGVKRGVGLDVFLALVRELAPVDHRVILVDPYAGKVFQVTGAPKEQVAQSGLQSRSTTRAA